MIFIAFLLPTAGNDNRRFGPETTVCKGCDEVTHADDGWDHGGGFLCHACLRGDEQEHNDSRMF